jgi:ribose transport system substrate-binding protein
MRHLNRLGWSAALLLASVATASAADKLRIGLVLPDLSNETIANIDVGARERAKELGTVEVLTTASYSGEEQASGVENYVVQHVDVIVYDSIDAAAVGPAIVKANKAGIPVIAIFSAGSVGKNATMMAPDFLEDGRMIGRWMVGKLGKDGNVAVVEGNPADAAGNDLIVGFKEAIAAGGIKEPVADSTTDWDRQRALSVATDMMTAHPDLQGMYGAIDDMALAALQAIKAAGRKSSVLLAGHNGTCDGLAALLRGDLDYTVMTFPKQIGRDSVDLAIKLKGGATLAAVTPAQAFGIDGPIAKAVASGDTSAVPPVVASDVTRRVMAAKNGCSK